MKKKNFKIARMQQLSKEAQRKIQGGRPGACYSGFYFDFTPSSDGETCYVDGLGGGVCIGVIQGPLCLIT